MAPSLWAEHPQEAENELRFFRFSVDAIIPSLFCLTLPFRLVEVCPAPSLVQGLWRGPLAGNFPLGRVPPGPTEKIAIFEGETPTLGSPLMMPCSQIRLGSATSCQWLCRS